jgi:hypothetical protein
VCVLHRASPVLSVNYFLHGLWTVDRRPTAFPVNCFFLSIRRQFVIQVEFAKTCLVGDTNPVTLGFASSLEISCADGDPNPPSSSGTAVLVPIGDPVSLKQKVITSSVFTWCERYLPGASRFFSNM